MPGWGSEGSPPCLAPAEKFRELWVSAQVLLCKGSVVSPSGTGGLQGGMGEAGGGRGQGRRCLGLPVCSRTLGTSLPGRAAKWQQRCKLEAAALVLAQAQRFLTAGSFTFLRNVPKNPRSPCDKPSRALGVFRRRQPLKYRFTGKVGKTKAGQAGSETAAAQKVQRRGLARRPAPSPQHRSLGWPPPLACVPQSAPGFAPGLRLPSAASPRRSEVRSCGQLVVPFPLRAAAETRCL